MPPCKVTCQNVITCMHVWIFKRASFFAFLLDAVQVSLSILAIDWYNSFDDVIKCSFSSACFSVRSLYLCIISLLCACSIFSLLCLQMLASSSLRLVNASFLLVTAKSIISFC